YPRQPRRRAQEVRPRQSSAQLSVLEALGRSQSETRKGGWGIPNRPFLMQDRCRPRWCLSASQRLGNRLARLRVQRPEIPDAAAGELLLEHGQVRMPSAAEILCASATLDAAVGQHEA